MAKVHGMKTLPISGRLDGVVYRRTREGVVAARQPRKDLSKSRKKKVISAEQQTQRDRFKRANGYVRRVLSDPLARRAYEKLGDERNRRFDRLIASDYLTPPEIEHVELSAYHGKPGDLIRVLAFDDVEVVSVKVEISTAAKVLLEQGVATKEQGVWNYKATSNTGAHDYLVIKVTAEDRPANCTTRSVMYP
jgi:hypothetical protein